MSLSWGIFFFENFFSAEKKKAYFDERRYFGRGRCEETEREGAEDGERERARERGREVGPVLRRIKAAGFKGRRVGCAMVDGSVCAMH